jgi:hypothetical protein
VSSFLGGKNVITIGKSNMDTVRAGSHSAILVHIEEEGCFMTCNKKKILGVLECSHFLLLSLKGEDYLMQVNSNS